MTNREKQELRQLCKHGYSFSHIRREVECSNSTIKRYMKVFSPNRIGIELTEQQVLQNAKYELAGIEQSISFTRGVARRNGLKVVVHTAVRRRKMALVRMIKKLESAQ